MNIRIIFPALFLLVLVTSIGNTTAQEDILTSNVTESSVQIVEVEKFPFYAFVQIIHRDSDGNLLAYIESDKISVFDSKTITELMDLESSQANDPVYQINADQVQVIVRQHITEVETVTLSTDSQLLSNSTNEDGKEIITLRIIHDGYLASPGDTITTYWNLVRSI